MTRPLAEVVRELRSRADGMAVNSVIVQEYYDAAADIIEQWMREWAVKLDKDCAVRTVKNLVVTFDGTQKVYETTNIMRDVLGMEGSDE